MKINSVAVLGAGAVGCYMISGLARLSDIDFCVVAEGDRADRLRRDGIMINSETYRPAIKTPVEAHGVDLLIVALKYNALQPALDSIEKVVGDGTIVMSLMNGVDSEDIIGARVGKEHMLYSVIKIASRHQDGGVCFNPEITIGPIFGELQPPYDSPRVLAVDELLTNAGLHFRRTDCVLEEIWAKFRMNIGINLPQAMLGIGSGCYTDSQHMVAIQAGLRREVDAIAAARGIDFSRIAASSTKPIKIAATGRYSTLQDLDAGKHTEIDMFCGTMMRVGRELGIPTPYNEFTYHVIKAIEEKNDGLFDYT